MATISQPVEQTPSRPSRLAVLWQFCAQNPLGAAGGFVVIVMIAMAVLADVVTVYDPTRNNFGAMLEAPGREYWLGTDQFGRDLYTRIVYGARDRDRRGDLDHVRGRRNREHGDGKADDRGQQALHAAPLFAAVR